MAQLEQDAQTTKTECYSDVANDVPAEFRTQALPTESSALADLFAGEDEEEDPSAEDPAIRNVSIAGQLYQLPIPPSIGTLFADQIWSGSLYLADYLAEHADLYCRGQRTVEFGAASALPSLVALKHGSAASMLTDFPEDDLLASIRHTVGVNWTTCGQPHGRVAVLGHEWGTDTSPVQQGLRELVAAGPTSVASSSAEPPCLFDTALLSECLWMHRSHAALAKSLDCLLHPTRGTAILTFCHHVPGHEGADLAFFQLCERTYNLVTVHTKSRLGAYQWRDNEKIEMHLRVLRRKSGSVE